MREKILLRCTECKSENYITRKNKQSHPERIEQNKFCPKCNKKTVHKQKK